MRFLSCAGVNDDSILYFLMGLVQRPYVGSGVSVVELGVVMTARLREPDPWCLHPEHDVVYFMRLLLLGDTFTHAQWSEVADQMRAAGEPRTLGIKDNGYLEECGKDFRLTQKAKDWLVQQDPAANAANRTPEYSDVHRNGRSPEKEKEQS